MYVSSISYCLRVALVQVQCLSTSHYIACFSLVVVPETAVTATSLPYYLCSGLLLPCAVYT